jgi:hypothetical protein
MEVFGLTDVVSKAGGACARQAVTRSSSTETELIIGVDGAIQPNVHTGRLNAKVRAIPDPIITAFWNPSLGVTALF